MTSQQPVTVLGLGLMGRALAEAFLRAGHPTTVWNRTPGKADQLVARGAVRARTPREAVEASRLVVVCVSTYDVARDLLAPLGDARTGRAVVNLTSGTSVLAREAAAGWGGDTYLDGAIMAVPPEIGGPGAAILYSGPRAVYDEHEPALRLLGGGTAYLGPDPGLAALYDVALLGVMWSVLNGALQGAALLGAAGAGPTTFAPLAQGLVTSVAGWLPPLLRQVDEGAYPVDDASVDTHLAAMGHLVEESAALGVSTDLPRLIKGLGDRAVADGHGGESYAAMIEYFRKPTGAQP